VPGPVVPLIRLADRVRALSSTGLDLVGLPAVDPPPRTVASLTQFDSIVSWYGTNRPEFRDAVAALGLPFRFVPALPDEYYVGYAGDFFLEQVGGSGPALPRIPCPRLDGRFAAIHPFSGSARKNWPIEQFRRVAERLDIPACWCAGPAEVLPGATRFDDLYELAQWLARARLYIGNDSGITHLAAAVGTPVVAVFGASDPVVWGPRGDRVRVLGSAGRWPDVEEVIAAALKLLAS